MGYVCDQIIPDWFAGRLQGRVGLHVGSHVKGANWEGDDGGIPFGDEFIFGKALDVEEKIRWEGVEKAISFASVEVLLRF